MVAVVVVVEVEEGVGDLQNLPLQSLEENMLVPVAVVEVVEVAVAAVEWVRLFQFVLVVLVLQVVVLALLFAVEF